VRDAKINYAGVVKMDVMEAIRKRCSVRAYQERPVEEEKLNNILEAARLAPSASNRQEWRFIVVQNKDTRKKLMKAARNQTFVGEAPVIIACCAETDSHVMSCGQLCYPIDVAIAIEHIVLKATEEGLGTCWIGAFYEEQVKEILGISDSIRVVELLSLGYAAKPCSPHKDRLSLREIVMYEKWGNRTR
jgi:nitroreductase